MNIVLIGMPASGKTTVAQVLGKMFKREVVDTDCLITKKYGNISEIFKNYGEKYFRDVESEAVSSVCKLENVIISTGGGAVLRKENVAAFKRSGKIIYLKTEPETLIARVSGDTSRPLLTGDAAENLRRLYAQRRHIYEGVSDFCIQTDGVAPQEIAIKIMELLK